MFERICAELSLGTLTAPPLRLRGGYTHRMFRLTTDRGDYAVKLLNPEIMRRPDALGNYRTAEAFEALLEARGQPILPAKVIGGQKMQCVDGQHLYVFDFFDGCVLTAEEITSAHCAKMGTVLAGIHGVQPITRPQADASSSVQEICWNELADALFASGDAPAEGALLQSAAPLLIHLTAAAEDAARRLPPIVALCHNDMDPKNVLWRGDDFRIIDLECLGYADPRPELLDLAIAWGGGDEAHFKAFVGAYEAAGGARLTDAALVHDARRNELDWLAYNARRALFDDQEERRIAREQICMTLAKIQVDASRRETVLRWLNEA